MPPIAEQKTEELKAQYTNFTPNEKEREYILKVYRWFEEDRNLKEQGQPILSGRTLQQFWDDSEKDYVQYLIEDDDWMKEYPSGMVRDKANIFISNLVRKPITPQITAQNKNQMTDKVVARALRALLEYARDNDGRPDSSGHQKEVDTTHGQVVEGTCHKMIMINADKEIETDIIPNEEVFIPTFYQTNIQKLSHFLRVQQDISYEEAKLEFGHLERFKSVMPGSQWMFTDPALKTLESRVKNDNVIIIRCWYPVPGKRQKYFNILINGVPMFDVENKDVFRHGYYPISKRRFEILNKKYYWGNSLGNKMRFDKKFATALRTLIIAAEKLDIMPPQVAEDGLTIDADMWVPGKITNITGKAEQVKRLGERRPVTQGDVALLDMINKSGDEASTSRGMAGLPSTQQTTLGEIQLREAQAAQLMEGYGLQTAFAIEAEAYLILKTIIQFYPRKKINEIAKVSIPEQTLSGGKVGTLEVIFENVMGLGEEERNKKAQDIKLEEIKARRAGRSIEQIYIDPSYADNLSLFIKVVGNPVDRPSASGDEFKTTQKYQLYRADPNINQIENTRNMVRAFGDDEETLVVENPQPMPQPGAMPSTMPQTNQLIK